MRTTIELPARVLREAMRHTKARTRTEAVGRALADFNRRQRLSKLAARLGTFENVMTRDELRRMREAG